jgi:hypothetical protein
MAINEFSKIKEFRIDNQKFELFKNADDQYFTVINELDAEVKSAQFYNNFEELFSVFSDELTEGELTQ